MKSDTPISRLIRFLEYSIAHPGMYLGDYCCLHSLTAILLGMKIADPNFEFDRQGFHCWLQENHGIQIDALDTTETKLRMVFGGGVLGYTQVASLLKSYLEAKES